MLTPLHATIDVQGRSQSRGQPDRTGSGVSLNAIASPPVAACRLQPCPSGRRRPARRRPLFRRLGGPRRRRGAGRPAVQALGPERQRHSRRFRRPLRRPAQRHALRDHEERHPSGSGLAAPADRRRLADGERRPAGSGPLHGAHGLQRHDERARERTAAHPGAPGPGLRRRHQRLHQLRPDRLYAGPAAHQRRDGRHLAAHHARTGVGGPDEGRGHRRRTRRDRGRGTPAQHPRSAFVQGPDRACRARPAHFQPPAHRRSQHHPHRPARTLRRVLQRLLSARARDPDRGRRLRRRPDGSQDPGDLLRLAAQGGRWPRSRSGNRRRPLVRDAHPDRARHPIVNPAELGPQPRPGPRHGCGTPRQLRSEPGPRGAEPPPRRDRARRQPALHRRQRQQGRHVRQRRPRQRLGQLQSRRPATRPGNHRAGTASSGAVRRDPGRTGSRDRQHPHRA